MEVYNSPIPFYAVAVSLAAVPLILLSARRPNLREAWTILAAVVKFFLVLSLLPEVLNNRAARVDLVRIASGVELSLQADHLGIFFALVASGLWILTSIFSIGYVRGLSEEKQTRYFASFALCLSATIGIAFAANLFTLLIFYEILTIATYPLVIHKETKEAISAGRKYLAYTLTAGLVLIAAVGWTYRLGAGMEFVPGGFLRAAALQHQELFVLFLLFILGFGVKAALVPLHSWLPAAMVAPTPVSALLHAVAVVKAGVFGILRVTGFVFGPELLHESGLSVLLQVVAGATIIIASLLALRQDNLKRMLAYSTIGHLSYIVLGAALASGSAFAGGLFHLAAHATLKITLFFCAGAIYVKTHRENISELDGIGRQMPWTLAAFTVASLGLIGLPPLNGFISKWFLGVGALNSGNPLALTVLLLSGLLNAGYLLPVVYRAYFKKSELSLERDEASGSLVVPLVVTAILSIIFGIVPDFGLHLSTLAQATAKEILSGAF
jgi:multicomponent Na+:H+ antiporter subunit D